MASAEAQQVGSGDLAGKVAREAFGSVYERYYSRLVRYCARLATPQTAQELAQETMTRALASLDRFDLSRPLWPWLKTIAINLVYDLGRRSGREFPSADPPLTGSQDHTQAVEDRTLLGLALARLSARQRAAIGLRYLRGWEPVQIGSHFGISPPAARQLLSRARTRLRIEFRRLTDAPFGFLLASRAAFRRSIRAFSRLPQSVEPVASSASGHAAHGLLVGFVGLALGFGAGTALPDEKPRALTGPVETHAHPAPRGVRSDLGRARSEGTQPSTGTAATPTSEVQDDETEPPPSPSEPASNPVAPDVPAPPTPSPDPPPEDPPAQQQLVDRPVGRPGDGPVQLRWP